MVFVTEHGVEVPAVTAAQMREVDRIAIEELGLGILQMMENAGRNLAESVFDMLGEARGRVAILAGSGGNGGGGICCARHLHNRGFDVRLVLDREPSMLTGAARDQLHILQTVGLQPLGSAEAEDALRRSDIVVDALIGYGLHGSPRRGTAELIDLCNRRAARVLSLDVPSGLNATSGEAPGPVVAPERTMTLALPKTGLQGVAGELYLADIGIPPEVYRRLGLSFSPIFRECYWVRLSSQVRASGRRGNAA